MWNRVPEHRPALVGEVTILAVWEREDGLQIVRVPNTWVQGAPCYSVREADGEFWLDSANRRRSWGDLGPAKQAADTERPLGGDPDAEDTVPMAATEPPAASEDAQLPGDADSEREPVPADAAGARPVGRIQTRDDLRAEARAFVKRNKDATFGDVADKFGLNGPQAAMDLLYGKEGSP